jgi:trimeric autotransporter adhesin
MASQVQYRRGTNAQNAAFTGALAEITVDTTNGTLRVHDAITPGGSNIATVSYVTAQISSLSANSITNGTSSVAVIASGGNIRANVGGSTITNTYSSGLAVTGLISATGNVTGAYLFGNASTVTGLSASKIFNGTSEANIGTSGGNANITIAGTSNVLVVASTGTFTTGLSSVTGNIIGGNISATNLTGTAVSVTGAVTAASVVGGVITGSSASVTGNITGGNVLGGANVNATTHTGATVSVTGAVTAGGDMSLVGNIIDTGPLSIITSSNGNISLLPNGSGNVNTSGNIMPTANNVSNIGSATLTFNTIFARATLAQYADLAEMYCADSAYTPGTVLDFGGSEEVTTTTQSHSTQVAGIVSTNPSYLMNSALTCTNAVEVALVGRVPCHVVGTIAKGDRLVASSTPGVATRLDMSQYQPGCIIGKALEAYDSETVGTIEVAVGRI